MDNQKIAKFQKQLMFLIEKHQEVHSQYEKNPQNSSLGEQLVHIQKVILYIDKQQKMVLESLRKQSSDNPQSSTSCSFSSLPNSPETQSPSTSSDSCTKNKCYHPEYSFITEENSYLLQDTPLDSDEESSYSCSGSSSRSGSEKRSRDVEDSEDPRDVATQNEFLLGFGMLPSEHLSDLLSKRLTRYKEKRNKLFFAPGPAEVRDALRKKKSLHKKTSNLPVNLSQEMETTSDGGMETTCGVCGASGDSVSQCGGCGYTAHPTCNPPNPLPLVRCPGDPWLCAHCHSKGIRADIRHDPLLLRNLSMSKVTRARAPVVRKEKKKRGFALRNYRAAQTSSQCSSTSSSLPPPAPLPSPRPILSTPLPPPKKMAKVAQKNTIKTRGRANRRPPSKYLNSPDIDSRDTSKHSTGRLTLATKSVKIARGDPKTIQTIPKPLGHPGGNSKGPNTIQLSTYNNHNGEMTRVNKSLTINFAAKPEGGTIKVKNVGRLNPNKHVEKRQNLMKVFRRILTETV